MAAVATLGAVTALLLVLLGWNVMEMHQAHRDLDARGLRLQREIGRVAYLDEALTLSATMVAITGDSAERRRYAALEEEVLHDDYSIARLARESGLRADLEAVKRAQDSLLAIEHRALALAGEGRNREAVALMSGAAYAGEKARYVGTMGALSGAFFARVDQLNAEYEERIWVVLLLSALSLFVLVVGFVLALRNVRRYVRLEQQEMERGARSQATLEARVRERTTVLEATSEQLRQAQKMEAVGQLAGGVAHDFNNLLTAIQGHAELLLADLGADHPGRTDVEQISKAAERAATLTQQLLAFGRRQMLQPQVVCLNEIVHSTDRMLRRVLGAQIELVAVLDPELPFCRVDPNQVEQVLVNLLVNARDAIGPAGGTITIETRTTSDDAVAGDLRCALVVRDTGSGMSPGVMSRIFEPFFTTKEVGKGTGLGLATVYGIVEQSGGEIRVESVVGQGSTFVVEFPACAPSVTSGEFAVVQAPGAESAEATLLLVEDEPAVRHLLTRTLVSGGYHVLVAQNGEEGCRVFARHAGEIDAVVSDVVMPLMGGQEMVRRLRQQREGLPVLLMSGYTASGELDHEVGAGTRFIAKPFTPSELVRTLRELLAEQSPGREAGDPRTTTIG